MSTKRYKPEQVVNLGNYALDSTYKGSYNGWTTPNWLRATPIFLAGELLRTWIWPIAVTAGGVMIGWSQHIQLFYLYVAAVFLFSVSSMGLLRFSEWRYRNRVADKLNFHSVRTDKIIDKDGVVKALRIGAVLNNKALFPVTFEVVNVVSHLISCTRQKSHMPRTAIPSLQEGWGGLTITTYS